MSKIPYTVNINIQWGENVPLKQVLISGTALEIKGEIYPRQFLALSRLVEELKNFTREIQEN